MLSPPPVTTVAVLAVAVGACAYDLLRRRVPNALTFGAAAVAVALHGILSGWGGVAFSAAGWATGIALFLPFYALGGMGAGDVKLLGAIGAWLGPMGAIWTGLYGAIAGGVLALAVALWKGYARTALKNVGAMLRLWSVAGVHPIEGLTLADARSVRLPYALPLAVGTLATLWRH